MKRVSFALFIAIATLSSLQAQAQTQSLGCTTAQVTSIDSQTGEHKTGNAFAISANELIVNDHTLGATGNTIQVLLSHGNSVSAIIESRDYQTDLALLRVQGSSRPCALSSRAVDTSSQVTVESWQKGSSSADLILANVIDNNSNRLAVPGVSAGLEIVAPALAAFREGRSGGIVTDGASVLGMLTERTEEGTALAIPAKDILNYLDLSNSHRLPVRPYQVDYRGQRLLFHGLSLQLGQAHQMVVASGNGHDGRTDQNQFAVGNPHDGRTQLASGNGHDGKRANDDSYQLASGNPHDGIISQDGEVVSIARSDFEIGYATAEAYNLPLLKSYQPNLAKSLEDAKVTTVFISAIDGISVKSNFEMIQALGQCQACVITDFWFKTADPQMLSDATMQISADATQLIGLLQQSGQLDAQYVADSIREINAFRSLNNRYQVLANGLVDPQQISQIQAQWEKAEDQLQKRFLPEEIMAIIEKIRAATISR